MSIFNPWAILGVVLAMLSAFGTGYWKGKDDEQARQQTEIARLNTEARETEQRMAAVAQTYAQTLRKANDVARIKETKLRTDLASGERKLFIPIKAPDCPVPATADAPAPSGSAETRAELDPRIAQSLVDLTSRGDQAIRQLNTCIDQYEKVRSMK
jgi:cobalamin biosynthesis Mg chelatase CobN